MIVVDKNIHATYLIRRRSMAFSCYDNSLKVFCETLYFCHWARFINVQRDVIACRFGAIVSSRGAHIFKDRIFHKLVQWQCGDQNTKVLFSKHELVFVHQDSLISTNLIALFLS